MYYMLTFTPLSNYIVIENIKEESKSGIIIPDTVKQPPLQGKSKNTVVTISEEKDKDGKPMVRNVKVGDNVLLSLNVQHTGQAILLNEKEYIVVRENDVLGILEGEEEETEAKPEILKLIKNPNIN